MSLTAYFPKFHNNHQKHDSSTIMQTIKTLCRQMLIIT